jgi:hypothetical protein
LATSTITKAPPATSAAAVAGGGDTCEA